MSWMITSYANNLFFVYTTAFNGLIFSAVLIASKFIMDWASSLGLKMNILLIYFFKK